ncbi:sensor histidine kinase [Leptothoe spongobia]|uniref:histidine kinase n=1 Tax=Leptothoe spongobia TAU-MAC 1115 TaxID=1967444 RepID=A0A947DEZ4_9CYAN|nr:HAMP domain-containing sensor histidine kinase [Leptothoe spongobia]MBT9315695.1 HAMP domain-containing histidine kinase [Leptothoe spongobia TAU-MAC 1115]
MDASTARSSMLSHRFATSTTCASEQDINPQFLKTAAQELNNPITTIKTALTLLNASTLKPKQRERYLRMIGQACDRQSHLIKDVFELLELQLTPQPTVLEKVQLLDLVPGVVSTYQPIAQENNMTLAYTVSAHLPPVLAIEAYLKQALVSLLSNSIRCANTNGRIVVTAHHRGDGKVALLIQDSGRLGSSCLPQGFQSFDRSASEGSGLGLTLVQQLLSHCGGSISVSRSPGEGTTLTILLAIALE